MGSCRPFPLFAVVSISRHLWDIAAPGPWLKWEKASPIFESGTASLVLARVSRCMPNLPAFQECWWRELLLQLWILKAQLLQLSARSQCMRFVRLKLHLAKLWP